MEQRDVQSAGCLIVFCDRGEYSLLVIFRKYGKNAKGYSLPKGGLEGDETAIEAAIRESREETGVDNLYNVNFLTTTTYSFVKRNIQYNKTVTWFYATTKTKELGVQNLSQDEITSQVTPQWLPIHEAKKKVMFTNDQKIIGILIEKLGINFST